VPGRRLEDNAMALLRFDNGARGMLWASTVTTGIVDGLQLRIHGEKAGLRWRLETSDQLTLYPDAGPARTLDRQETGLTAAGFIEGFANVYASVAEDIHALAAGEPAGHREYAGVEDGAIGIKFILAAIESSAAEGAWTDATLEL
jgi:predicted dehydrogenase